MSWQWSHQNIVTCHQGTMRQSRQCQEMRDEESQERERGFAFCWVSVQQKSSSRGWKNWLISFTQFRVRCAANNPSLVFVINFKSLIYIFQLLDVWIARRGARERRASLGPGQLQIVDCRGGGSQEPFEIPSTDSPQPAMPPSQHNCLVSLNA